MSIFSPVPPSSGDGSFHFDDFSHIFLLTALTKSYRKCAVQRDILIFFVLLYSSASTCLIW